MLDDLADKIAAGNRSMFMPALQHIPGAITEAWQDRTALVAYAKKSPDRAAQAATIVAKLCGVSERQEIVDDSIAAYARRLKTMPDHELRARSEELVRLIKKRRPPAA